MAKKKKQKQRRNKKKITGKSLLKANKKIEKNIPIPKPNFTLATAKKSKKKDHPKKVKKKIKEKKSFFFKLLSKLGIPDLLPDLSRNKVPTPEETRKIREFEEENKIKYYKFTPFYFIKKIVCRKRFDGWCNHPKVFYKIKKTRKGIYRITICKKCYAIIKDKEFFPYDLK